MDEPVVYFKPGCPFGFRLRTALTLHRVPHRSVRFRDDEDGAARVRDVNDGSEAVRGADVAGRSARVATVVSILPGALSLVALFAAGFEDPVAPIVTVPGALILGIALLRSNRRPRAATGTR